MVSFLQGFDIQYQNKRNNKPEQEGKANWKCFISFCSIVPMVARAVYFAQEANTISLVLKCYHWILSAQSLRPTLGGWKLWVS